MGLELNATSNVLIIVVVNDGALHDSAARQKVEVQTFQVMWIRKLWDRLWTL